VNLFFATQVQPRLVAYAFFGACAGVYLFYRGFVTLQRKRLIENTPTSKVHSAAMGLVEISGLACGPSTIPAPISGMSCYFHHSIAWEWRREGRSNQWVKVAEETAHVPYFLEDGTGRILVDPQGAEMSIHRDFSDQFSQSLFSSSLDVPINIASFLSRHGVSNTRKIKIEEYCIKPKNALFVLGTLAENHATYPSGPLFTPVSTSRSFSWRISRANSGSAYSFTVGTAAPSSSSTAKPPMDAAQEEKVRSALIKAGITNPAAWAAAGIRTAAAVMSGGGVATAIAPAKDSEPQESFDLHPPVVLRKGGHNPAFFISWQSQREIVKALGWKSAAMIWGGPALTLLCVYAIAAQLGWL